MNAMIQLKQLFDNSYFLDRAPEVQILIITLFTRIQTMLINMHTTQATPNICIRKYLL